MNNLKNHFLAETFIEEKTVFASGNTANNRVVAERMSEETFNIVAKFVGNLALQLEPDVITYIPAGARQLAESIARKHKMPLAYTKVISKRPGHRMFGFNSMVDKKLVEASKRLVAVEDVSNTDMSLKALMEVEAVADSLVGRVCILDRGLPQEKVEIPPSVARLSLFDEQMPAWMDEKTLDYYKQLANELNK
jgi:hypothetical protein